MQRGVSASKEDVHNAIKNIDKGIFPQAFCKIIPDILGGDPEYCNIMHADGAGTKSSLAYLYWKETGDLSVWKGIAQDALIMNIDDLLCVGAVDNILVSSTIGRNKLLVPGEVISAIINGTDELLAELRDMGVGVYATGGETFGKFLACPGFPECRNTKPIVERMPGRCPRCGSGLLKRKSKRGYPYYACERGAECGFMSWDVPTAEDCPVCGQTLFKKSGKGRMKPFCINEKCPNFLPEDQRGYRRKVTTQNNDPETAVVEEIVLDGEEQKTPAKKTAKKTAAKKTTAKKSTAKKTAAKKPAAKKTTAKKPAVKKTAKKTEETGE